MTETMEHPRSSLSLAAPRNDTAMLTKVETSYEVDLREQMLLKRREDAERHHHKQVGSPCSVTPSGHAGVALFLQRGCRHLETSLIDVL